MQNKLTSLQKDIKKLMSQSCGYTYSNMGVTKILRQVNGDDNVNGFTSQERGIESTELRYTVIRRTLSTLVYSYCFLSLEPC